MRLSPTEAAQIITALAALGAMFTSAIGIVVSFLNRGKIDLVKAHVEKVEKQTDGMKTELVNEVRAAAFGAGEKKGAQEEKTKHIDER